MLLSSITLPALRDARFGGCTDKKRQGTFQYSGKYFSLLRPLAPSKETRGNGGVLRGYGFQKILLELLVSARKNAKKWHFAIFDIKCQKNAILSGMPAGGAICIQGPALKSNDVPVEINP